jgi:chemotaxis family two-component system response regulator Rcp1
MMRILLVEDNAADARLVQEALKECSISIQREIVSDGLQAMAYLRREGRYSNVALPHLILLDLHLPKKDGREVIMETKADATLQRIPVIVFSSSQADDDVLHAYSHGANCYVLKPLGLTEYFATVRELVTFWATRARLPLIAHR